MEATKIGYGNSGTETQPSTGFHTQQDELPFTGFDVMLTLLVGVILVALGTFLLARARHA